MRNAVIHTYDHLCVLSFKDLNEEEVLNALIEGNVDVSDIETENDMITLYGNPQDLYKIKQAVLAYKPDITFDLDEITMIPHERIKLEGEDLAQFKRLLELLDDLEDVQEVYHNVELD